MYFMYAAIVFISCLSIFTNCDIDLVVIPVGKTLVAKENTDLNLTCKVISDEGPINRFDLTWKLPTRSSDSEHRISIFNTDSELTITIHRLHEQDTGQYTCELTYSSTVWTKAIYLFVRPRNCSKPFFHCGNGLCIPQHYVCDGFNDCPNHSDESYKYCGANACQNKILCEGRCIPKEYCCDPSTDANCTVKYIMSCCLPYLYPDKLETGSSMEECTTSSCKYGPLMSFSNPMLYLVISCAIVVMIVSSLATFLACRVCVRRSTELLRLSAMNLNNRRQHHGGDRHISDMENDVDTHNMNLPTDDELSHIHLCNPYVDSENFEDFVLLEFVDGSGYKIADCRPRPPPYTETALGVPPPPYESDPDLSYDTENLTLQPQCQNDTCDRQSL